MFARFEEYHGNHKKKKIKSLYGFEPGLKIRDVCMDFSVRKGRPSSLPARVAFREKTSAIYRRKFHADDVRVNFVILHKLSFAVFCQ